MEVVSTKKKQKYINIRSIKLYTELDRKQEK
jgi:hypothetical protein